ncbi:MAG: hypothetical protein ACKVPX_06820 [Myxococcaceae bacterium]
MAKTNAHRVLDLLSDEQVLEELGRRFEDHRQVSRIPDQQIFDAGGAKKDALAHFKKGQNISLLSFIRILRGAGLLGELDRLLRPVDTFSPIALVKQKRRIPKRIRNKKTKAGSFAWGDE